MTDDLKRFIEGFDNEDALRRAVEALLMKMPGCTNVRATHGSLEQGKDIIFCSDGPMGEILLNACVIKNEKISGSAESSSGARTVFHQVEQSLDTPILNEQGQSQAVSRAYVIWRELSEGDSRNEWTLRLYLDGLDEVPNHTRQIEIAKIAATGVSPKVQIIVTARDHVSGPWLSWLRRLEIQAFDDQEVRQLTDKWLDGDPSKVSAFYQKLKQVPSLGSLMKVPLLGTLILAVYKHGYEGLPESRPRLYEMFVRLLAGGWDAAKN
ncbi:MAG: hypothetical protein WB949_07965, partial [Candidatus Acidiferrales bacterium]